MATQFIRRSYHFGGVGTTKILSIATNVATNIILDSGYQAITIFNLGSGSLIWGDSNIAVNSGNYIYPSMRTEWLDTQDGWNTYVRADSVSTLISVTQYSV